MRSEVTPHRGAGIEAPRLCRRLQDAVNGMVKKIAAGVGHINVLWSTGWHHQNFRGDDRDPVPSGHRRGMNAPFIVARRSFPITSGRAAARILNICSAVSEAGP